MTTAENALMIFSICMVVGMTLAGVIVPQVRRVNSRCRVNREFDAVQADMARAKTELIEASKPSQMAIAHDYCAGCDTITLRKMMRWTPEGTWRCTTCCPIDTAQELRDEIEAAGAALDDPDSAARLIPLIVSVPGRTFATLAEARAAIRYMGNVGTIKMHTHDRWGHRTYEVIDTPQSYVDQNAKPVAYGITVDGEWSLWANERQARLYASQQDGKHCVVRPDAKYWRVDVHPLDWRPTSDDQVGWTSSPCAPCRDDLNDVLWNVAQYTNVSAEQFSELSTPDPDTTYHITD